MCVSKEERPASSLGLSILELSLCFLVLPKVL